MTTITRIGKAHWIERGKRIEQARNFVGLSQEQLADRVGELLHRSIGRQVIYNIEKGKRQTSVDELRAIAVALDQSEDWLDMEPRAVFNAMPVVLGLLYITWNDGDTEIIRPRFDWVDRPIDVYAVLTAA